MEPGSSVPDGLDPVRSAMTGSTRMVEMADSVSIVQCSTTLGAAVAEPYGGSILNLGTNCPQWGSGGCQFITFRILRVHQLMETSTLVCFFKIQSLNSASCNFYILGGSDRYSKHLPIMHNSHKEMGHIPCSPFRGGYSITGFRLQQCLIHILCREEVQKMQLLAFTQEGSV